MLPVARGNAAEAAILAAFVKRGYLALVPFGDGQPYDVGVDLVGPLLRVQCKRAWSDRGCVVFNTHSTDHGNGRQSYVGRADLLGVYFPPLDAVYLVPIGAIRSVSGRLRLEPTRNNQRRGIRMAADYEIDCWTPERLAALAPAGAPAAA
ncbi:MAG: group I intron-associated PD-(D/E)XK endonuclease [Solirubrobacterales bacterium]